MDPKLAKLRRNRLVNVSVCGVLFGLLAFVAAPKAPKSMRPVKGWRPLPHQLSKFPGGTALRLAMVHDVLHERYPRHGDAYNEERLKRTQAAIDAHTGAPTASLLDRYDDLGAALDRLHRSTEAVDALREKQRLLAQVFPEAPTPEPPAEDDLDRYLQEALAASQLGPAARAHYRTAANLGTFLMHANFRAGIAGDAQALAAMREGLGHVARAVALNPGAHFGRERWQLQIAQFIIDAAEHPDRLTREDFVGNTFKRSPEPGLRESLGWGRRGRDPDRFGGPGANEPDMLMDRWLARNDAITLVGGGKGTGTEAVAFDEPTLGILGMWMLGGGPNPHFALTLGGIMERVGQRYLAWSAYTRALSMAERFWPAAEIRETLVAHCEDRRRKLAAELPASTEELQTQFEAELELGTEYQAAYQAYEAEQIAAGANPNAPTFYAAFEAERGSISSPPGTADSVPVLQSYPVLWSLMVAALGAGLGSWVGLAVRSSRKL